MSAGSHIVSPVQLLRLRQLIIQFFLITISLTIPRDTEGKRQLVSGLKVFVMLAIILQVIAFSLLGENVELPFLLHRGPGRVFVVELARAMHSLCNQTKPQQYVRLLQNNSRHTCNLVRHPIDGSCTVLLRTMPNHPNRVELIKTVGLRLHVCDFTDGEMVIIMNFLELLAAEHCASAFEVYEYYYAYPDVLGTSVGALVGY